MTGPMIPEPEGRAMIPEPGGRAMLKWSVSIKAEGDRPMELEEIVELADAVAPLGGVASGVGAMSYGAQIVVEAESSDQAVEVAIPLFEKAVVTAGIPPWPVTKAEVIGEDEGFVDDDGIPT